MDDDDTGGLLNIEISDAEDDGKAARRTGQSEAEFQKVKKHYKPKIENGNPNSGHVMEFRMLNVKQREQIKDTITLPLAIVATKQQVQEYLHAIEELYFFRKYFDATQLIEAVLNDDASTGVDDETRNLLVQYLAKCRRKLEEDDYVTNISNTAVSING